MTYNIDLILSNVTNSGFNYMFASRFCNNVDDC